MGGCYSSTDSVPDSDAFVHLLSDENHCEFLRMATGEFTHRALPNLGVERVARVHTHDACASRSARLAASASLNSSTIDCVAVCRPSLTVLAACSKVVAA